MTVASGLPQLNPCVNLIAPTGWWPAPTSRSRPHMRRQPHERAIGSSIDSPKRQNLIVRVVRQKLANGLSGDCHASRATSAPARACSAVRPGMMRREVRGGRRRSLPSVYCGPMPTTECGLANPVFHYVTACRIPHLSDLLDCLSPLWRFYPVTSGLVQTRRGPDGLIREHSRVDRASFA